MSEEHSPDIATNQVAPNRPPEKKKRRNPIPAQKKEKTFLATLGTTAVASIAALIISICALAGIGGSASSQSPQAMEGGNPKCEHVWNQPNCTYPKTCSRCQGTQGDPNPEAHVWNEANCVSPKTCVHCKKTEGESNPDNHWWSDTADQGYMICKRCGKVTGDASKSEAPASDAAPESQASESSDSAPAQTDASTDKEGASSLSPAEFKNEFQKNSGISMTDASDEDLISYVENTTGSKTKPVMLSFANANGDTLGSAYANNSTCGASPIMLAPSDNSEAAAAFVMTCDPSLSYSDALDLLIGFGNDEGPTRTVSKNGLTYSLTGLEDSTVMLNVKFA